MATSGRMTGNHISIGGVGGQYYFIDWQLASQSVSGNSSRINWQAYWHFQTADAQLDNGNADLSGNRWSNGGRVRNYGGSFTTRNVQLASGSFDIGHNADGTRTLSVSGGVTAYQSGRSSGSASWSLPTIPRQISINSWSLDSVTEQSINVAVSTGGTANLLQYSVNGGGWTTGYSGTFTSRTITIPNLNPNTTYNIKIRVRSNASGLYTESGTKSAKTTAVTITSLTAPTATDTSISVQATTSHTVDLLQYRQAGTTTWIDGASGAFTNQTVLIGGLESDESYTFEFRARHQFSQTWTAISSVTATTQYPQPLQPSNLVPANNTGVGTLEPVLSWQYQATSVDTQSAFQVVIRRLSNSVVVWDSGKVVDDQSTVQVPSGELSWNETYQWQVRTWSGADIEGPYSANQQFKTSEPPTASIVDPADEEEIATGTPTIEWSYADPESTTQAGYTIELVNVAASGVTEGNPVYTFTEGNSASNTHTIPEGIIENENYYVVRVTVVDADGVSGTSDWSEFFVSYVAPSAPNISVELSDDLLYAQVGATTNPPVEEGYEATEVRLYRRVYGESEWQRIGVIPPSAEPEYFINDYELKNNTSYEYAATAFNSEEMLESTMAIYETPVEVKYKPMQNTFLIPMDAQSDSLVAFTDAKATPNWSSRTDTTYHFPVGRRTPVVYTLGTQQYRAGSIQLRFFDERLGGSGYDSVLTMERIKNEKPIMLRTWWGEIIYISIDGQIGVERLKGVGWMVNFTWTEIGKNGE